MRTAAALLLQLASVDSPRLSFQTLGQYTLKFDMAFDGGEVAWCKRNADDRARVAQGKSASGIG
jgi:hypothetical protein